MAITQRLDGEPQDDRWPVAETGEPGPLYAERLEAERRALDRRRRLGIKRFLPRTLFGRSLMIIVTPLLLMHAIATFYFYDRHWDLMAKRLSTGVAGEVGLLIEEFEATDDPAAHQELFSRIARHTGLVVIYFPGGQVVERPPTWGYDIMRRRLTQELNSRIPYPFAIDPAISPDWVEIQVQMPDGLLRVMTPLRRLFSDTTYAFILFMIGSSVILFTVAILFMRNQIRPIRRLALAAEQFGKGRDPANFKLEGASEVRQAARAFLVMRERIQRQITQRTDMLAGVSHDLRTPLTRMKLQLAMLGDSPEVDELKSDVAEMERMIEGYLAFARGEGAESLRPADLGRLLEELVATVRREGAVVSLEVDGPIELPLRQHAFRRCLANLLANARKYGRNIWIHAAWRDDSHVALTIDDDGPGIPDRELENVFKPFYRIDRSRNQATGGTGLGLTIARDVARKHGGDIRLSRSPYGGLRCTITLPA